MDLPTSSSPSSCCSAMNGGSHSLPRSSRSRFALQLSQYSAVRSLSSRSQLGLVGAAVSVDGNSGLPATAAGVHGNQQQLYCEGLAVSLSSHDMATREMAVSGSFEKGVVSCELPAALRLTRGQVLVDSKLVSHFRILSQPRAQYFRGP